MFIAQRCLEVQAERSRFARRIRTFAHSRSDCLTAWPVPLGSEYFLKTDLGVGRASAASRTVPARSVLAIAGCLENPHGGAPGLGRAPSRAVCSLPLLCFRCHLRLSFVSNCPSVNVAGGLDCPKQKASSLQVWDGHLTTILQLPRMNFDTAEIY